MVKDDSMGINVLILAAGHGRRMGGRLAKVLHEVGGRPMLAHVYAEVLKLTKLCAVSETVVLHGPGQRSAFSAMLTQEFPDNTSIIFAVQTERLGTGHATQTGLGHFGAPRPTLVLYGDQPLIDADNLAAMAASLAGHSLCLSSFTPSDPTGLGRLILDDKDRVLEIVEEKDASDQQRQLRLCNGGVMALGHEALALIDRIDNHNKAREYYLTDLVLLCRRHADQPVTHHRFPLTEMSGANTLAQLAELEALWQQRTRQAHLAAGVQMIAPETVFFSHDTHLDPGCLIEPHVVFGRGVQIGSGTRILAFSHLEGVTAGADCRIGPFARIRPDSQLGDDVRVGNFVEVKASKIDKGTRASHLSYLGNSEIGERVNVGAGTITCNYDGFSKARSIIQSDAFIGSNTALVAPITIGSGSIVGAGSTIDRDVTPDSLTVSRAKPRSIPGGAEKLRARNHTRER